MATFRDYETFRFGFTRLVTMRLLENGSRKTMYNKIQANFNQSWKTHYFLFKMLMSAKCETIFFSFFFAFKSLNLWPFFTAKTQYFLECNFHSNFDTEQMKNMGRIMHTHMHKYTYVKKTNIYTNIYALFISVCSIHKYIYIHIYIHT